MWHWQKPSERTIEAFRVGQAGHAHPYAEVGASRDRTPAGFNIDHNRVQLGKGAADFATACDAVRRWQMFPAPWTEIYPPGAPIRVGQVVAVLAHAFGLWWTNACRIVYVLDETTLVRRFGFAYGTLPDHVECGEERFSVEWTADDAVWYDLRAFSRPRHWSARLAYPLARRLQRQFAIDSKASMCAAVAGANHANP